MSEESATRFMDIYEDIGEVGAGWKLTDEDNNNVVVYARFNDPPAKTRDYYKNSNVSWNLVEVL
jgi:hypothetical protein